MMMGDVMLDFVFIWLIFVKQKNFLLSTNLRTFIYSNFFERQWEKIYVPLRMTIFYWKVCLLLYHAHFWPSRIKFPEFLPIQWFYGKNTQKRGYTITAAAAIYFFPIMMSLLIQLTRENVLYGHYKDSSLSEGLQIIGFLSRDTSTRIEIRVKNRIGYLIFVKGPRLLRFFLLHHYLLVSKTWNQKYTRVTNLTFWIWIIGNTAYYDEEN